MSLKTSAFLDTKKNSIQKRMKIRFQKRFFCVFRAFRVFTIYFFAFLERFAFLDVFPILLGRVTSNFAKKILYQLVIRTHSRTLFAVSNRNFLMESTAAVYLLRYVSAVCICGVWHSKTPKRNPKIDESSKA